jgi:DNA-binding HxlR family transcriptional regulator
MSRASARAATATAAPPQHETGESGESVVPCPLYHDAVELIGRRWTGAIVAVLLEAGPLRFRQIAQAVPDLSDRLLAQRMKELEARGIVERTELPGRPVGVQYALTPMGRDLDAAVAALRRWAQRWLG